MRKTRKFNAIATRRLPRSISSICGKQCMTDHQLKFERISAISCIHASWTKKWWSIPLSPCGAWSSYSLNNNYNIQMFVHISTVHELILVVQLQIRMTISLNTAELPQQYISCKQLRTSWLLKVWTRCNTLQSITVRTQTRFVRLEVDSSMAKNVYFAYNSSMQVVLNYQTEHWWRQLCHTVLMRRSRTVIVWVNTSPWLWENVPCTQVDVYFFLVFLLLPNFKQIRLRSITVRATYRRLLD